MDRPLTLEARRVSCRYGATRALEEVSIRAESGSIVAVVGPNGAGKSTLLRVMSGERRPDAGSVIADGQPISRSDPAWRCGVSVVSHRTGLYLALTAAENLRLFAGLHGLPRRGAAGVVAESLASVGGATLADRRVSTLSRGQAQRVSLARALLSDPRLLLLDEPFAGLDDEAAGLLEGVLAARRDSGCTVLLVTHDLSRAVRLADRIVVLRRGRKRYEGAPPADPGALVTHLSAESSQAVRG